MRALGIDIGGSSVKLAFVENHITQWTNRTAPYSQPTTRQLIDALSLAIRGKFEGADAIGICVPGLLDQASRKITDSINMPGLIDIVLDNLVAEAIAPGLPRLHIVNDAVAAAVDVVQTFRFRGRIACIALGTGVGLSVLDDGAPLHVEAFSPGHLGQMDVSLEGDDDIPIGPDGGAGSLEAYIGVPALLQRYGSTEHFFNSATISDPPLRALARAIRICHAIYRPHNVVLVGGVGIRLKHILPDLKQLIGTNLTRIARSDWTINTGEHDFHAAIGAARLASSQVN